MIKYQKTAAERDPSFALAQGVYETIIANAQFSINPRAQKLRLELTKLMRRHSNQTIIYLSSSPTSNIQDFGIAHFNSETDLAQFAFQPGEKYSEIIQNEETPWFRVFSDNRPKKLNQIKKQ